MEYPLGLRRMLPIIPIGLACALMLGGTSSAFGATVSAADDDGDGGGDATSSLIVDRDAGRSRFDTAVKVSQDAFPDGADTVYVVSGLSYPDALAAGPAAAKEKAPVLLARQSRINATVMAEIARLKAKNAVIVGGTDVLSDDIESTLSDAGLEVTRVAGDTRVDTSIEVAKHAFADGASSAILADGWEYADALSAGASIGANGPLLLVPGASAGGELSDATTEELTALKTTTRYIAGGEATVPESVSDALDAADLSATRLAGEDRYETSATIATTFHETADRAFIATGLNWPDALTGAALAANVDGPLLLAKTNCVPTAVSDALTSTAASRVTLLGGASVLGDDVVALTSCDE